MSPAKIKNRGPAAGSSRLRVLLHLAAAAVLLISVRIGARGFLWDLKAAFGDSPRHTIPPEIEAHVASLRGRIPPGESLFYVGNRQPPDPWFSRLWQRAFYPTRVVIFDAEKNPDVSDLPPQPRPAELERLRKSYAIRYAISAGNPPLDPGFASREELAPIPYYPYAIWFGELRP